MTYVLESCHHRIQLECPKVYGQRLNEATSIRIFLQRCYLPLLCCEISTECNLGKELNSIEEQKIVNKYKCKNTE